LLQYCRVTTAAETALTLDALSAEVSRRLAAAGRLDARTIRYYTTLGIVDPPARRERQAVYGERQVLQLAAIKALQVRRLPLAEIQRRLVGRSDAELRAILEPPHAEAFVAAHDGWSRPRRWRELTLEPGLRVAMEEGWAPSAPLPVLLARVRELLAAFAGGEAGAATAAAPQRAAAPHPATAPLLAVAPQLAAAPQHAAPRHAAPQLAAAAAPLAAETSSQPAPTSHAPAAAPPAAMEEEP
jgi:DNA-binding transcriptional MerR regulator